MSLPFRACGVSFFPKQWALQKGLRSLPARGAAAECAWSAHVSFLCSGEPSAVPVLQQEENSAALPSYASWGGLISFWGHFQELWVAPLQNIPMNVVRSVKTGFRQWSFEASSFHPLQHQLFTKVILKDFTWWLPTAYFVWDADLCFALGLDSASREVGGKRTKRFSLLWIE